MKKNKFNPYTIVTIVLVFCTAINTCLFAEEASVLERVRKVEAPELAELIKIAKENYPYISVSGLPANLDTKRTQYENEIGLAKVIRTVTEKYAQIKLLDKKIELLEGKIKPSQNQEIKPEFMITKASLESERLKCIAELREALNLTPWTPLGPKEVRELNTWLYIELSDDVIRIFNLQKPFSELLSNNSSEESRLDSSVNVVEYMENILKKNNTLPIRITLSSTEKQLMIACALKNEIKAIIKKANAEYETDISSDISILNKRQDTIVVQGAHVYENSTQSKPYSVQEYLEILKSELQQKPHSLPRILKIKCVSREHGTAETLEHALHEMIKELKLENRVTTKNVEYIN